MTAPLPPERWVALPERVVIEPPAQGVAAGVAALLGAWAGRWGEDLRHALIVEAVEPSGRARVVYALGDSPMMAMGRNWARREGMITAGVLKVQGFGTPTYRLDGERLFGTFVSPQGHESVALLSRIDASTLSRLYDADTVPLAGERVFLPHARLPIRLEARLFRPRGNGPAPLAIINHGSATGSDLHLSLGMPEIALWLRDLGYVVLVPMRRGRGHSEGEYGEWDDVIDQADGSVLDIAPGVEQAVEDLESTMRFAKTLPFVAAGPALLLGQSRGGFLAVVFAGRKPEAVAGVVNFVGGWMGGSPARLKFNTPWFEAAGREAGARVQQLWLYGDRDSYYNEAHIRANHSAFVAAGGRAEFHFYKDVPGNGHYLRAVPRLWRETATAFVRGLPR
jgi:dienelactone hydrolase